MTPPALRLTGLSKAFPIGQRLLRPPRALVRAVQPVTLDVAQGETLGIVGESGCGKSTLARMLVGLLEPSSGTIAIEGAPLDNADPAEFGKRIQYVFQDPQSSLNPRKTIRQIMEAPLRHLHGMDAAARRRRIAEIFDTVSLRESFLDRYPHEFSGGQRQRIGVARALALEPKFIICDEPVSALDVSIQAQILNLLERLQEELGLAYLFIAHDLAVVSHISDDVAVMYLGRIVEKAPSDVLYENPLHPYTKCLMSAIPRSHPDEPRERIAPHGEVPSVTNPPPGCPFHPRCPWAMDRCPTEVPSLRPMPDEPGHWVACYLYE
jgi:peptide/nickel transport system ATP-binding protein